MNLIKKEKGFTIIELLVVIFIIGTMSSMVLAGYRRGQHRYALSGDIQKLVANLRKAQNMAMSGTGVYGEYCGYGIQFDYSLYPTSYRLYADKALDCDSTNYMYDAGDDIIETVNLSSRIQIQSASYNPLDIFFLPPDPITFINGDASAGRSASVTLEISGDDDAKTVTVSTAGLIQ